MSYIHENEILIDEDRLTRIEYNKYFIEISKGNFVDLKKVYLENKELQIFQQENKILYEYIKDNAYDMHDGTFVGMTKDEVEKILIILEE